MVNVEPTISFRETVGLKNYGVCCDHKWSIDTSDSLTNAIVPSGHIIISRMNNVVIMIACLLISKLVIPLYITMGTCMYHHCRDIRMATIINEFIL